MFVFMLRGFMVLVGLVVFGFDSVLCGFKLRRVCEGFWDFVFVVYWVLLGVLFVVCGLVCVGCSLMGLIVVCFVLFVVWLVVLFIFFISFWYGLWWFLCCVCWLVVVL